jgi:hypothetical protein
MSATRFANLHLRVTAHAAQLSQAPLAAHAARATQLSHVQEATQQTPRRSPFFASLRDSKITRLLPHQFATACGVAAFWRGTWYMMDAMAPADPLTSGLTCLTLGFTSFALGQSIVAPAITRLVPSGPLAPVARFGALYAVAVSCVATWRGVWCLVDVLSENIAGSSVPEHLIYSGCASHVGALGMLVVIGRTTAILAPPSKPGLLNDRTIWGFQPEDIRWLDWTFLRRTPDADGHKRS